jgi:hypothetical protein
MCEEMTKKSRLTYFLAGFFFCMIFLIALKFVIDRITEKQKKEANEVVVADEVICEWNIKHSACFCSRPSYRDKYGFQHNEVITWVPERVCGI